MGATMKYKCSKCDYETDYATGPSGFTDQYILAFVCDKIKDVVQVSGQTGAPFLSAFSRQSYVKNDPIKNPVCPVCKDHNLGNEWDETTCPKCGYPNSAEETGAWD